MNPLVKLLGQELVCLYFIALSSSWLLFFDNQILWLSLGVVELLHVALWLVYVWLVSVYMGNDAKPDVYIVSNYVCTKRIDMEPYCLANLVVQTI